LVTSVLVAMWGCVQVAAQDRVFTASEGGARDTLAQPSSSAVPATNASPELAEPPSDQQTPSQEKPSAVGHKLGALDISINWRTRAEDWNWFQGNSGNSDYPFWHSLLRVGIGQNREHFDRFVEGEQVSILGLPNDAVVAPPQRVRVKINNNTKVKGSGQECPLHTRCGA